MAVAVVPVRMPDHWPFDYSRFRYMCRCRHPFNMPVYDEPYPNGTKIGVVMYPGDDWVEFDDHQWSPGNIYISVKTNLGWVNIWTRFNRVGSAVGVVFAHISVHYKRNHATGIPMGHNQGADGSSGDGGSAGSSRDGGGSSSSASAHGGYSGKLTPAGKRRRRDSFQ